MLNSKFSENNVLPLSIAQRQCIICKQSWSILNCSYDAETNIYKGANLFMRTRYLLLEILSSAHLPQEILSV